MGQPLANAAQRLELEVRRQFEDADHIERVTFRAKGVASFVSKVVSRRADPPYTEPLLEVEDQIAGRILVFFLSDLDSTTERATELFGAPVEQERKIPTRDEEFGYQSDHLIFEIPTWGHPTGWETLPEMPTMFELQIRTLFQHAYAEPQHELGYNAKRELAWIAASAWGADQAYERVRQQAHD